MRPPSRRPTAPSRPVPSHLDDLLDVLWPDAWSYVDGHSPRRESAGDFLVMPGVRNPRLLLPRRPRRATAGALRHFKASASGRAAVRFRVLSLAARLGLAELLPDRVRVHSPDSGVTGQLSRTLGVEVSVSLYIGPQRAVQKPVLQLLNPAGETFAFAKVSTNTLTRRLIQTEARSLARIAQAGPRLLRVPILLHHGLWDGRDVTVQEALTASARSRPDAVLLSRATVELARLFGVHSSPICASTYWERLRTRVSLLPPLTSSEALLEACSRLEQLDEDTPLTFGSWHGDWAPWNMTQAGGQILVWDWEHLDTDVPLGFDALHYFIQHLVVAGGAAPDAALEAAIMEAPTLLGPFEMAKVSHVVLLAYVIEIATRYIEDGELDVGTRMGRLDSWLPQTLDRIFAVMGQKARG